MKSLILISGLILISISICAQQINVPADQPSIQAAIEAATDGDTVLVADSTYYENINFLGKAITVASRFILDGDTAHISKTIIDGSQSSNPDTSSTVLFISGEDTTSVLMGFTITGGTGTVVKNLYESEDFLTGGGLAILNSGGKIISNIIEKNQLLVTDSNTLTPYGGGLFALVSGTHHAIIRNNEIKNNSVSGNRAYAGGIGLHGGGILVEGNYISKNSVNAVASQSWVAGGGIKWHNEIVETMGGLIIRNNVVIGNIMNSKSGWDFGGGITIGGGLAQDEVEIYNNVISDHHLENAGSALNVNNEVSSVTIYNNTIVNNSAGYNGSSVVLETKANNNILLYNNIIWSGLQSDQEEIFVWYENSPVRIYNNILSVPPDPKMAKYVENNVYEEPQFKTDSYELAAFSPGIGQGVDTVEFGESQFVAPPIDLFGKPRPHPIDGGVDMGAIESPYGRFVNIPDENFKSMLISNGIDENSDGEISFDEAKLLTFLNIYWLVDRPITDLIGIEACVNLDTLIYKGGGIYAINEIDLSKNKSLKFVKLTWLRNIENHLSKLNISGCDSLIYLDCSHNTLESLDLSNCTLLEYLDCGDNKIDSLSLTNNRKIGSLIIDGMKSLTQVCVWDSFSQEEIIIDATGSPNVYFTTECLGSTKIEDLTYDWLNIYPNPTNSLLTIETENPDHYSIEIASLNGQLIHSTTMEGTSHQIDLSSFEKGAYFITIRSEDFVTTRKIIKL